METATLERAEKEINAGVVAVEAAIDNRPQRLAVKSLIELTKPRIALMLVLSAAASFYLGSPAKFDFALFTSAMIGIALLAFGVATLNQFIERETDALMKRTSARPLPSKTINSQLAFVFGVLLCLAAEIYLALTVNILTALLGVSVIVGYVLLYTPLKTKTSLSTVIGAFPGAMPALMGWTAAAGEITIPAWVFFSIMFFWQFPHFLAIAWLYREDYAKAGILMLPVVEPSGRLTAQQIVVFSLLLLFFSFAPFFLALTGWFYLAGAVILGLWFVWSGVQFARSKTNERAKMVFRVSIIYLPLLFLLAVLNRQ